MKQDRISWSKELLPAESIAELLGKPTLATGHPQWPAAVSIPVSSEGVTIEFEPGVTNWQDGDQVVVALYVPPGIKPSARMRIDCGSETPGLQGNDYMRCYYRYLHEGWGRVEFPYENMLIFGIPDGWRQVTRVRLTLGGQGEGEYQIAALAVEKRERAPGPRLTDEELFAEINLDWPGLGAVSRLVDKGDLEGAKDALVDYYRTRSRPRHAFRTHPSPEPGYDRQGANRICDHYILNQQLDRDIDWRANPIGYLEWMHAFNRHFFLITLIEAYLATAEEKYARELDYLLSTWISTSPVPVTNNGGGDPAWETLSTACRINRAWPALWYALEESTSFQPRNRVDMLASFYEHAEHLIPYPTGHNWLVAESAALATIGLLFPEFKKAERWRAVGLERLGREVAYQVYPDGAQFELSPGYHRMCANLFADVFELATLNGYPIPRSFAGQLESMYAYTMHVTRPDGTRPSLNDAGSLDASSAPELTRGHALFGREDWLYAATCGGQGVQPEGHSHAFPYAGHYVMRTGWDKDALWAVVDAGPYGAAHQHEDKLNLELYAYGTRFIVDPGIASYLDDPWTHYARSTAAHNTVIVDGRGQDRRTNVPRDRYRVEEPEEALWGSSERLDFLWASYRDGYQGIDRADGLVHSRLVLFLKPRFWVIWDVLAGQGEHEMSALYHFGPMLVQYSETDGVVRSNRLGLANVEFLPLGEPDSVEIVCGEHTPVQGWLAIGGKLVPAPTAIYRLGGELPLSLGTVAVPFRSGVSSGLSVQPLETGDKREGPARLETAIADAAGHRFEVAFTDKVQEMACGSREAKGAVTGRAQGLVVHRGQQGRIRYIAGLNCQQLSLDGAALAAYEAPRPLVEVEIR